MVAYSDKEFYRNALAFASKKRKVILDAIFRDYGDLSIFNNFYRETIYSKPKAGNAIVRKSTVGFSVIDIAEGLFVKKGTMSYRSFLKEMRSTLSEDQIIKSYVIFLCSFLEKDEIRNGAKLLETTERYMAQFYQKRFFFTPWAGKAKEMFFIDSLKDALKENFVVKKLPTNLDKRYMIDAFVISRKTKEVVLGISIKDPSYFRNFEKSEYIQANEARENEGNKAFTLTHAAPVIRCASRVDDYYLFSKELKKINEILDA